MSAAMLLGRSGPLSYYYISGADSRTINIDPTITVKAFLVSSGGAVTQLHLTDRSIYMLQQSGNLSLFNASSQIASVSGSGGGIVLANYTNIPGISSAGDVSPSLLLAISPGVPPSTSEVSRAGVGLTPNSTQNGKNYYIVRNSGNIRFNTTRPKTIYYVGAGGQGGASARAGNGIDIERQSYYHAGSRYSVNRLGYDLSTHDYPNTYLQGGGAGSGGGGGGGSGGIGKIVITSSNYLNCIISSNGTSVYTEDKYLGVAGNGSSGTTSPFISSMDAYTDGSNPPNCMGGNRGGGDHYYRPDFAYGGPCGFGGTGGTVTSSYTGTTIIPGCTGGDGSCGGAGQSQGFKAEQPSGKPPPRVIFVEAQDGALYPGPNGTTLIFNRLNPVNPRPTRTGSPCGMPGNFHEEYDPCYVDWDNLYNVTMHNLLQKATIESGRDGSGGFSSTGFGRGVPGSCGKGGQSMSVGSPFFEFSRYRDSMRVYALGGGGGGGGNGAPGFSLDTAEGTTGLDAQGDTNGCVIIVVG